VWIPLHHVPELAAGGQLLGAGTAAALLYYLVSHPLRRPVVRRRWLAAPTRVQTDRDEPVTDRS
jgi:peptidoglycan/LPS O-acetylase OafA/YrhL